MLGTIAHYNGARKYQFREGRLLAGDIAGRIAELREVLGWTQVKLGKELGRNRSAVNAWERGRRPAPEAVLRTFAVKRGWPPAMWEEGGPRPATVVNGTRGATSSQTALVTLDRVNDAVGVALGRVARYAVEGRPVPWKVVMEVLAGISEEIGLIERVGESGGAAQAR